MNVEDAVATLKRHAEPWGVYLNDPCSTETLSALTRDWERDIGTEIPADYLRLLRLTNGLQTQRGHIFDALGFLDQNWRSWCAESSMTETRDGVVIHYQALAQRRPVRHAWLGTGDSVDQYVYDYASARFNVARLGLDDQVFESFADLGSMLLFLGNG